MCHHIYDLNIVNCDVKQKQLTPFLWDRNVTQDLVQKMYPNILLCVNILPLVNGFEGRQTDFSKAMA